MDAYESGESLTDELIQPITSWTKLWSILIGVALEYARLFSPAIMVEPLLVKFRLDIN